MQIYTITNTHNGKQYVGKTQETPHKRFRQHLRDARNGSTTAIHRALRKYDPTSFLVEQIDTATTKLELSDKERFWIARLDTLNMGYNMTPGGEGHGHKHSDSTKDKIRIKQQERFKCPEERKKAATYGRLATLSPEGRERHRTAMLGNKRAKGMTYRHTNEAKLAIGMANKGKVVSELTRQRFAQSRIGKGTGSSNAMADPINRAKVAVSKLGRKKMFREDGSWFYGFPGSTPQED